MRFAHPVAQVRAAEAALLAELPEGTLMARAAAGIARRAAQLLGSVYGARVVLLVGSGDNGGDALYAGARLAARGARVDALLTADARPERLAALARAGGRITGDADVLDRADLVVDGLVGIGAKGALREPATALAEQANSCRAAVLAVDLPSGVDADTGAVAGTAVHADVTVTFGALKPGLLVLPGSAYAGLLDCVDIGLDLPAAATRVLDAADVAALLPDAPAEASKYSRGVLGVAAGSTAYTGAAVLVVGAAVRAGAGMVRFAGARDPAQILRGRWPEAVVTDVGEGDAEAVLGAGRVQAWVVGPGLGTDAAAARVVEAILRTELPVLVDADAIIVAAERPDWLRRRSAPTLLTPHAGEFTRLTGADPAADRLGAARAAAADLGASVLLKGSTTVVADPDGTAYANRTGTVRLATAGSGDVLAGAAGALLAQGLPATEAGAVAAFLHGLAAQLAGSDTPIAAGDLIEYWPAAVRAATTSSG